MCIVQTFWTGGQDPLKHAFGWLHPEYNLMSWALSCLSLREHYDEVALYTDSEGKRILIDELRFPLWPRRGWEKYRYRWYGNILKKYSCVYMRIYVLVRIFLKTSVCICICMLIINSHPLKNSLHPTPQTQHFVDNGADVTGKKLSHVKYSSKRSDSLRFYAYLCHVMCDFACLETQH